MRQIQTMARTTTCQLPIVRHHTTVDYLELIDNLGKWKNQSLITCLSPKGIHITARREGNCVILQGDLQATIVQIESPYHLLRLSWGINKSYSTTSSRLWENKLKTLQAISPHPSWLYQRHLCYRLISLSLLFSLHLNQRRDQPTRI